MLKEEGTVRRNDLNLRLKYIGLKTEIYQVKQYQFRIYCINYSGNFEELKKDFDFTIKNVGINISLANERPTEFIKRIDNISLSNVVDGFKASCITKSDLDNFIRSKFYYIDMIGIEIPHTGMDFEILIKVSVETEELELEKMRQYLLDVDLGTDKVTILRECCQNQNQKKNEVPKDARLLQFENSHRVMHLELIKELPFTVNEADFWYENAEDIYTGKITRKDIYYYRGDSLKCFLDFSVFDNVDLRNVLLLYDTVYLALPIEDHLRHFLEQQDMTLSELIELVDMGKVVLLLPNLETRYDKNLLLEVYRCNPLSIVGRRGLNILLATHLAETKHQYEKHFPGVYNIASEMYMQGMKEQNANLQNIARMLAWPITATVDSFRFLNQNSPMSISNFGINNIISDSIKDNDPQEKIAFEFTMNALSTHIATALQATYFPFRQTGEKGEAYSDHVVSNIMGNFLKVYWYDAANLQNIIHTYQQNNAENNYLKLFECKHNIKITKVASLADEYNLPQGFRDLLFRLGNMDEDLRKNKIREYNDLLFETAKISGGQAKDFTQLMLGYSGFLPLNYPTSIVLSLLGIIKEKIDGFETAQRSKELKLISNCVKANRIKAEKEFIEDIYLLDKVSRVAILK